MRRSIRTLALTGLLTLGIAAGVALAQDNANQQPGPQGQGQRGPRRMDPDAQLKHLTQQLDLTADQQAQIKPILVERDQQQRQVFQDQSLSPDDRHSKMKTIHDASNAKIEAILNDTQKQKYAAMQSRMMERRGPPPQGEAPAAPQ